MSGYLQDDFQKIFMDSNRENAFKEQIAVEKMIDKDPPVLEYVEIRNKYFLVNLFGLYQKLRPFHLEKFVSFCSNYLKDDSLRKMVLKKVFKVCPTLIQRLFRISCFSKDEIKESLEFHHNKTLFLFFKNVIEEEYPINDFHSHWCRKILEKKLSLLLRFV